PNFLHAGDHVHLGPGVSATRKTNPAVDLHELPRVDLVLLSHYHGDHFDQHVEASLRRNLPIVTTSHAKEILTSKGPDSFTNIFDLEPFQQMMINIDAESNHASPSLRVTGMPGKHVPTVKPVQKLNELVGAVPPTNGWMLELGYGQNATEFTVGYRIYISGDTLMVDDLKEIPKRYGEHEIDLMLIHLGGTTIPSPSLSPFTLMVTMDAKQGVELMQLVKPDVTVPIHYDDYDVFASPLDDFKNEVTKSGLGSGVVYLDRGEEYRFKVRSTE
ncbi:beta-lactamase superfamily domain-containing protein, partial [Aspergillus unguis]